MVITSDLDFFAANLPPVDPFDDLDPLLLPTLESDENGSMIAISEEQKGQHRSDDESSDEDSEREYEERTAFDVFSE